MCAQEPEWNELDKLIDPEQRAEPPFLQVEPQTMDLAQSKWKQIKWVSWPPKWHPAAESFEWPTSDHLSEMIILSLH